MPVGRLALLGRTPRLTPGSIPRDLAHASVDALEAVERTLRSGLWSMFTSKEVEGFEVAFAHYVGAEHAVFVNSCTTAILAALRAEGIGAGDRVAVPAFTYVGTCLPVLEVGARPVWIDVGSREPNMDAASLQAALSREPAVAAIVPLLFGSSSGVADVVAVCEATGTGMIFDCAQFLGHRDATAELADRGMCCFSFGESKILRIGEGGAVATNSRRLAERVRRFRHEGESWLNEDVSRVELNRMSPLDVIQGLASTHNGLNLRPLAMAAALGRMQLEALPQFLESTSRNARELSESVGSQQLLAAPRARDIWWSYPCEVLEPLDRDVVLAALLAEGVPAGVHFPRLVPHHPIFMGERVESARAAFPRASRFADRHLVLPIYPAINPDRARLMGQVVREVARDPSLASEAARQAASRFLRTARLADLSSGLYMFLVDP